MKHSAFIPSLLSILMPALIMIFIMIVGAICVTLLVAYAKFKLLGAAGARASFIGDFLNALLSRRATRNAKFCSKQTLMSDSEQELFRRLIKALPDHFVFPQVAFSQFLYTAGGDQKENFGTMATVKQKVADFIVCSQRFQMVAVIELDDASHNPEKDAKRDAVLKEAGLKPVRWHVSNKPDTARIRWDVLGLKDGPEAETVSRWAPRPD